MKLTSEHKKALWLSIGASGVMIVIGYLVWLHEQKNSAAATAANAEASAVQEQELENELNQLQSDDATYAEGNASMDYGTISGNTDGSTTGDSTDALSEILDAYFGNGTSSSAASTVAPSNNTSSNIAPTSTSPQTDTAAPISTNPLSGGLTIATGVSGARTKPAIGVTT